MGGGSSTEVMRRGGVVAISPIIPQLIQLGDSITANTLWRVSLAMWPEVQTIEEKGEFGVPDNEL